MINKLLVIAALTVCISCSVQPSHKTTSSTLNSSPLDSMLSDGNNDSQELKLRRLHAEVKANPDNPEPLYQLAVAYWDDAEENNSQTSRDNALVYFKKVLALAPDNQSTLQAIYNIHYKNTLSQGQPIIAQAKASYQSLSADTRRQLNPPSLALFIHHYIQQHKADKKDYPLLQQLLLDAINEQPLNDNAYIHLASLYRSQGYYPMALANLKLASEKIPDSSEIYAAIAKTYEERAESEGCTYEHLAQLNSAIEYYKHAIPLDANNAELHFRLAQLYLDKNQYQLAFHETGIMLELDPNPENLAFMAQQYSMHNNPSKAKAWLSKAQRQGLNESDASFHEIYMNSGDWPAAANAFTAYAKARKYLNAYDAIKADIISKESKRDLLSLVRSKEIHFSSDWEAAVFAFWTNKITQQQLAKQASNRCERTELFFYSGYRNLISGNDRKAKQELAAVLEEKTYRFVERPLARHFLEKH
jgi:cytochrome c-type biogenesis protein CcmH/NrfG